ncbi:MAG: DUF2177 family protein [Parcubacteria group bacterium]|nr:DUF2177 family protein [Parcubacteria group bacterium]
MIKLYFYTLAILILLDALWLNIIAGAFYKNQLGALGTYLNGKLQVNIVSAAAVYLLLALGLVIFVYPKTLAMSPGAAFLWGALFGAVVYGIYDLTNHAIIKNWSLILSLADISWGIFLCGATALLINLLRRII